MPHYLREPSVQVPANPRQAKVFSCVFWKSIEGVYVFLHLQQLKANHMKLAENSSRISEIQCRLSKYTYLSRNNLPGYPDAIVLRFLAATNAFPDRAKHPNFYHWYILMRQFSPATLDKWLATRLYLDPLDSLPSKFTSQETSIPPYPNSSLPPTDENTNLSNFDQKNTGNLEESGAGYVIDIQLPCGACAELGVKTLQAGLEAGKLTGGVEVVVVRQSQLKVRCRQQTCKCEDLANFITRLLEFRNIQIKRQKKSKNPCL